MTTGYMYNLILALFLYTSHLYTLFLTNYQLNLKSESDLMYNVKCLCFMRNLHQRSLGIYSVECGMTLLSDNADIQAHLLRQIRIRSVK